MIKTVPHFSVLVLISISLVLLINPSLATDYTVAPGGDDGGPGSSEEPFEHIQHAADLARAGDTIHVLPGTYTESVRFVYPGTGTSPITCVAEGDVTVNAGGELWSLFVDGYQDTEGRYVVLDGFKATGAVRGGFRASWAEHVTFRNCTGYENGRWGIFTDYSDDLLIENNTCYGNIDEHGIYVSNSGDRPVIRGNYCYNNGGCGIQINADPAMEEGDGITSEALIENNICSGNGVFGGAAINLASVRDSVIRNNLLVNNLAGGIAGWGDGNGPEWGCKNNRFFNNTIYFQPGEGRWCISLKEGSVNAVIHNNILMGGSRGAFEFSTESLPGLVMDYNILSCQDGGSVVTEEDTNYYDLPAWQGLGYDTHSKTAAPESVFTGHGAGDFHHPPGSPGIDCGTDQHPDIPVTDMEGSPRRDDPDTPNTGAGSGVYDLGCYEFGSGAPVPTPTPGPSPTPVPETLVFDLDMGAYSFAGGDTCYLDLDTVNSGTALSADLYVILEVYGMYWFYPSWSSLDQGIDYEPRDFPFDEPETLVIIPVFTMPDVSSAGPFHFFAAAFLPDTLSVDTMVSNLASVEFYLE